MAQKSDIEWCDSTLNGQMGCDGCELWRPKQGIKTCYAGTLTERYGGQPGWPAAFDQPKIFPGRIEQAARWPDLTGRQRADKPWLSGLPRLIFLDDMGDTFTESLPLDWLLPEIPIMASSHHLWLFLTKRPKRMRLFFEQLGYIPANFWLGTSITGPGKMSRAKELAMIEGAFTWLSLEPLLEPVDISFLLQQANRPGWIVIGGQSGTGAKPLPLPWARSLLEQGRQAGAAVFVKQLGSAFAMETGGDSKGGDWLKWPEDIRVREMPPFLPVIEPALQQLGLAL